MLRRRQFAAGAVSSALMPGAWPGAHDGFRLLDASQVPGLTAAGRAAYENFLLMDLPRAFALSRNGATGLAGGTLTEEDACAQALAACRESGGADPRIYAKGLSIIDGNVTIAPPLPPPALVETWNYRFVPDARFIWRGPGRGRGAYIWAHGTSTDPNGLQPPPHVRLFNNAGFDIIRFDRELNADDVDRAAGWLRRGIRTVRGLGWTFVIAGGHSRGAWNCLQMLQTADLADVALAFSPAAHGTAGGLFMSAQIDDLRTIVRNVPKTRTRLAFIQFSQDMFIADTDADMRLIERLRPSLSALLTIDRPDGFYGHTASRDIRFAERFGAQLLGFVA